MFGPDPNEQVAIELPVESWVAIVALLDKAVASFAAKEIEQLGESEKAKDDLAPEEITAILALLTTGRATIVDKLMELERTRLALWDKMTTPSLEHSRAS